MAKTIEALFETAKKELDSQGSGLRFQHTPILIEDLTWQQIQEFSKLAEQSSKKGEYRYLASASTGKLVGDRAVYSISLNKDENPRGYL